MGFQKKFVELARRPMRSNSKNENHWFFSCNNRSIFFITSYYCLYDWIHKERKKITNQPLYKHSIIPTQPQQKPKTATESIYRDRNTDSRPDSKRRHGPNKRRKRRKRRRRKKTMPKQKRGTKKSGNDEEVERPLTHEDRKRSRTKSSTSSSSSSPATEQQQQQQQESSSKRKRKKQKKEERRKQRKRQQQQQQQQQQLLDEQEHQQSVQNRIDLAVATETKPLQEELERFKNGTHPVFHKRLRTMREEKTKTDRCIICLGGGGDDDDNNHVDLFSACCGQAYHASCYLKQLAWAAQQTNNKQSSPGNNNNKCGVCRQLLPSLESGICAIAPPTAPKPEPVTINVGDVGIVLGNWRNYGIRGSTAAAPTSSTGSGSSSNNNSSSDENDGDGSSEESSSSSSSSSSGLYSFPDFVSLSSRAAFFYPNDNSDGSEDESDDERQQRVRLTGEPRSLPYVRDRSRREESSSNSSSSNSSSSSSSSSEDDGSANVTENASSRSPSRRWLVGEPRFLPYVRDRSRSEGTSSNSSNSNSSNSSSSSEDENGNENASRSPGLDSSDRLSRTVSSESSLDRWYQRDRVVVEAMSADRVVAEAMPRRRRQRRRRRLRAARS